MAMATASASLCGFMAIVLISAFSASATSRFESLDASSHNITKDGLGVTLQNASVDGFGFGCMGASVGIVQARAGWGADHVPQYSVQIFVQAPLGQIRDLRFSCGDFASLRLVNPNIFRRTPNGYCLEPLQDELLLEYFIQARARRVEHIHDSILALEETIQTTNDLLLEEADIVGNTLHMINMVTNKVETTLNTLCHNFKDPK